MNSYTEFIYCKDITQALLSVFKRVAKWLPNKIGQISKWKQLLDKIPTKQTYKDLNLPTVNQINAQINESLFLFGF